MDFSIKSCTDKQLPEILDIFNDAIMHSTALYDYKIRTLEMIEDWYNDKQNLNQPIIGAFNSDNVLLGFASFGSFRPRPANKYTVEHSVYVHKYFRAKGIGKTLLNEIIIQAEKQNYHVLIGVIDTENKASIILHEKEGFELNGILKEVAFKFGKWLDVAFYQKTLKTPLNPDEL